MKASKATDKNSDNSLDTTADTPPNESEKAEIASGTKARVRETTTRTKVYISDVKAAAAQKPATENGAKPSETDDALETVLDVIDQIISSGIGAGMKIRAYKVRNYDGSPLLNGRVYLGQKPFNPVTYDDDIQALCPDGGELAVDFCYPDGKWYERNVPFSCGPLPQQQRVEQQSVALAGQPMTFADMQKMQNDMKMQVLQEMKLMKEIVGGGSGGGGFAETVKVLKDLGLVGGQQTSILETVKLITELRDALPDGGGGKTTLLDIADTAVRENPGVVKEAVSVIKDYFVGRMRPNITHRAAPRVDIDIQPEGDTAAIDAAPTETDEQEPEVDPAAIGPWMEALQNMIVQLIANNPVDAVAQSFVQFKQDFPAQSSWVDVQLAHDPDTLLRDIIDVANNTGAPAEAQKISESKTARGWLVRLKDKILEIEKFRQFKNNA